MRIVRLLFVLTLVCAPLARAGEAIVVAFDGACIPTQYADAQGRAAGIYPAIVGAAFARIGAPARLEVQPFRRAMAGLREGTLAGGAVVMTAERQAPAAFSAPYFTETVGVYTRGDDATLRSVRQLRGKRVGVIRGWSYGAEFDAAREAGAFTVEEVDTDLANFRKLALGRVDAVMATTAAGELLRRLPGFALFSTPLRPILAVPIRLAINRNDARRDLLARFDRAIEQMRKSGEIDAIAAAETARAARVQAAQAR